MSLAAVGGAVANNHSSNRSKGSSMKSIKSSSRSLMRVGGSTLHWKGRVVGS